MSNGGSKHQLRMALTTVLHKQNRAVLVAYLIVLISSLVYFTFWTQFSILKLLALHDHVFDLGLNAERGWLILHTNLGIRGYVETLVNSAIVFPVSPLTGSGNYFAIIAFQVFMVTITGFAFFRIALLKGLSLTLSTAVAVSFFLYFPVYGIFWYDFHYQALFLPLFVLGYMFYLSERYSLSFILLAFSGLVRFPYSIFPLAFALIEISALAATGGIRGSRRRLAMLLLLIFAMLSFIIAGYAMFKGIGPIHSYVPATSGFYNIQSLDTRIFVLMLFLAPLLFLPLFSPRWLVFALPAFYLILTSGNFGYTYPFILQGQYVAGIVPFLFLGFIDGLILLRPQHKDNSSDQGAKMVQTVKKNYKTIEFLTVIFIVLILLNLVYAPFGPMNSHSGDNFNAGTKTTYNSTTVAELNYMIGLIPANTSYVAYQDNLPQVLPRPLPYGSVLLLSGYLGNLRPFNITDVINNSWPVNLQHGMIGHVPIDYAIADGNNQNFYYQPTSMRNIVSNMFQSGKYGILAEGAGLILLERGYKGAIMHYMPRDAHFASQVFTNFTSGTSGYSIISETNDQSDNFMFYGPGTYLYPGNYTASFLLKTDNLGANNSIWIQVTSNLGTNLISFMQLHGTDFVSKGSWHWFNLTFSIDAIYGYVEFRGFGIQWAGTLWFGGVQLLQTSSIG